MEGMLTTDMEVRGSSSTVVTVSGGGETTLDTLFSVVKKRCCDRHLCGVHHLSWDKC